MKYHFFSLAIIFLMSFFSVYQIIGSGLYFPMHDDAQVARVIEMGEALRSGQFPVRWVSNLGFGFGYPIYNFYAPLPYYFGGLLYLVGFSGLVATKLMMIFGFLLVALTSYILGYFLSGKIAGIGLAIFSVYAPYHAVQLFVRGAVGEFWAYAFLPLIPAGIILSGKKYHKNLGLLITTVGFCGMILSHTVLGYFSIISSLFISVILYLLSVKFRFIFGKLILLSKSIFFSLFITSFYWLPAVFEKRFTSVEANIWDPVNLWDHFLCPIQIWSSQWGFGGSAPGCLNDGMSFMLGKIHIIAGVSGFLAFLFYRRILNQKHKILFLCFSIIFGISVFMMLPASSFIWKLIPNNLYFQYPWRMLSVASLLVSVIFILGIDSIKKNYIKYIIIAIFCLLAVLYNFKWFRPQYIYTYRESKYLSNEEIKWRVSRISSEYLPPDFKRPDNPDEIAMQLIKSDSNIITETLFDRGTHAKIQISSVVDAKIILQRAYFTGWEYFINGKRVYPVISSGLPGFDLPVGFNVLEINFRNTPIRNLGNFLSIIGIGLFLFYYVKKNQN